MRSAFVMLALLAVGAGGVSNQSHQEPDYRKLAQEWLWTADEAMEWIDDASRYTEYAGGHLGRLDMGNISDEWNGDRDVAKLKLDEAIETQKNLTETLVALEDQLKKGELRISYLYVAHAHMDSLAYYLMNSPAWWPLFRADDDDADIERSTASVLTVDGFLLSADADALGRCLYGVVLWHEGDEEHAMLREHS